MEKLNREKLQVKEGVERSNYEETKKEKELLTRKKESSNGLYGGYNETIFVKLKDDGSGIFKPKTGEREGLRREIKAGTYYERERAAYLVDRFLGFDLVPPTVIREIDGKIGSFQEFIDNAKTFYEVEDSPAKELKLMKLWIFDLIIYNTDRHPGNILFDKEGKKLYAIDNGLAFGKDQLYTCGNFFGKPIPDEIKDRLNRFLSSKDKKSILKDLLEELLPENEVKACFKRLKKITELLNEKGSIPGPLNFEGEIE